MCFAYGYSFNTPVVTDDTDMIQLGQMFGVQMIKMVELLRLMLEEDHIDMDKIEEIAQYLQYMDDPPVYRK